MPNSEIGVPDDAVSAPSTDTATETEEPATVDETRSGPPRWLLIAATIIPLVAVIVIVVLARRAETTAPSATGPLAVPVVFQPGATTAGCAALDAALPATLDGRPRRTLVAAEPGVAAWGDPPAVMRCGIDDPAELTCSSSLTNYNKVSWLTVPGTGSTTFIAVDRSSRVALTLDDSVGVGAVQALSNVIAGVMQTRAVCTDGTVVPPDRP
jgi:Protein of unknown function (DUF3515)